MKTLGQIAYEAASKVIVDAKLMPPPPYSGLEPFQHNAYEAAANAIIELCAQAAEQESKSYSHTGQIAANRIVYVIREMKTKESGT
jgi:hypothetical protein